MLRRIAFVDMLRGVAALLVLFHHAFLHFPATFAGLPAAGLSACAWLSELNHGAVLLFFVVSGFSIRASVESLDLHRAADVNEYAYRRLKRILPLYVFALAFSALCVTLANVPVDPRSLRATTLLGNLLFLQTSASVPGNWFPPFAGNGPLWSLSYEMFYYLLFPLHVRVVRRPVLRLATALAISAAGLVGNRLWPNPIASFAGYYAAWYSGVELAEAYLGHPAAPRWLPIASWLVLLVARFTLRSATIGGLFVGATLLVLGLALIRWPALQRLGSPRVSRLVIAAFAWVGSFSYALYLLHFPLLLAVGQTMGAGPAALLIAVIASCVLAIAAERLSLRPRYAVLKRQYLR